MIIPDITRIYSRLVASLIMLIPTGFPIVNSDDPSIANNATAPIIPVSVISAFVISFPSLTVGRTKCLY